MLVLGIETSGERGEVALVRAGELLAEHRFPEGHRHARNIMVGVDDVVRRAGVAKGEIEAVAVTQGPGSFTGLRVGVTCAKSLAELLGWRAVGVPTLDVLAANVAPEDAPTVCPLLDARRRFVYGAVYEWQDGAWRSVTGLMAAPPSQVAERIPAGTLVFGSGALAYPDVFGGLRTGDESLARGHARQTAWLGQRALAAGEDADPMALVARYYRRTEAEETLAAREAGDGRTDTS